MRHTMWGGSISVGDRSEEMKGNLKETAGKITGNERMENEGKAEKDKAEAKRQ